MLDIAIQKSFKERFTAIRSLKKTQLVSLSQRMSLTIKDVGLHSFFEYLGNNWFITDFNKYEETSDDFKSKKGYFIYELTCLCLETGKTVNFEWEFDDELEISMTLDRLSFRDLKDDAGESIDGDDLDQIADDMSDYIWRVREDLFGEEFAQPDVAASKAADAFTSGETPIVLADYSDRSGDATHVLREVVDQSLSGVLIATVRDEHVIDALLQGNAKAGDRFSMDVGGFSGPASGKPVHIDGTLTYLGNGFSFDTVAIVDFGDRNSLIITPALKQVIWTEELLFGPLQLENFDTYYFFKDKILCIFCHRKFRGDDLK